MELKKKHKKLFKSECNKWIDKLGLHSWDIHYFSEPLLSDYAQCHTQYYSRIAKLIITSEIEDDLPLAMCTDEQLCDEIKKWALHECIELLLSPLGAFAEARGFDKDEYEKETHIVIRTLEKVL